MTVAVSNNRTSVLVASQVPQFIREDHNTFVQFVQSYYRFLEDANYKKAVRSNLSVSTEVGPPGPYKNTATVYLSSTIATSNVAIANGSKVNINGTVTYAKDVQPSKSSFTVDPPVPTRIVQGDFYVYEARASAAGSQLMDMTKNWARYMDIDVATTDNQQVRQKLYDNFIKVLPKNLLADKTLVAKHARDFYQSKGSESSIQFLLRALYNVESEFYYPKSDVLRASDGKWYIEKVIRITDTQVNNVSNNLIDTEFVGKLVTGEASQAKAVVEGVNVYYKNGRLVTELTISNSDKPFFSNERIFAYYQDSQYGETKFISASVFGGQIVDTDIIDGGTGYLEGMVIPVIPTDNTGNGAKIIVSKVSRGGINRIFVGANNALSFPEYGGVGYQVDDIILISGGGGTGALGGIESVWDNNFYHPNTYNLSATTFGDVADYLIGDYGEFTPNLDVTIDETVANTVVSQATQFWKYGPTGPVKFCYVVEEGENYGTGLPVFTVQANTRIKELGILGKMVINDGGRDYNIGDTIEFINTPYKSFGAGASANVTNVNANGAITEVHFVPMKGHFTGGSGYNMDYLPRCNVRSSTGTGANIAVTNILGTGGSFVFTTESLGIIKALKILNGGTAYEKPPILDLSKLGDGKAQVTAFTITGIYYYPGRYINDDGFVSSKNKLQDRDYYQNFSYVIKSMAPINRYRPMLKSLAHPAGMKMFGRYEVIDMEPATMNVAQVWDSSNTATVSNTGLRLWVDTANTVDPFTGLGYEYTVYDYANQHIIANSSNALATDMTGYYHPTTLVSLVDKGYIGTVYNGAIVNQDTGIMAFDGTNEYAKFPINADLDLQTLSVEAWFAPDDHYQNGFIMEKGYYNQQYGILMQANKQLVDSELIWRVNIDGFVRDLVKFRGSLLNRGWNYVATTHTSGAQRMYVNGKLIGSNNVIGNVASPPSGITLAASGQISGLKKDRTYYFEGKIGIIRIYNRTLNVTEVAKNFNRERGRFGV